MDNTTENTNIQSPSSKMQMCPMMKYFMDGDMPMDDLFSMQNMMMPVFVDFDDERQPPQPLDQKINRIVTLIERNNPEIYRVFRTYGVPIPAARRIVRRIVRLTLMYSARE